MKKKYVYMLRTCNADGTSHNGFVWPKNGIKPNTKYSLNDNHEFEENK